MLDGLDEPPLLLVLDGVTDPHNLGACLRSADAFGAHAVIVPKDRAVGVNATVAKAASGAADTVPVITVTNLARDAARAQGARRMARSAPTPAAPKACSTPTCRGRLPGCWAPKERGCAG